MAEKFPDDQANPTDAEAEPLLNAYRDAVEDGHADRTEENALQFMAFTYAYAQDHPSADLMLKMEAHRHEEAGEWAEAEAAYRQVLELAVSEGSVMAEFKAHEDLSLLHGFLGQSQRATAEAEAALDAARRADLVPLLTMALDRKARGLLQAGEAVQARRLVDEMLRVVPDGRMGDTQRARGLVLRARCCVEAGEHAAAQADLDAAQTLLAPIESVSMFAGVQSALAGFWEATARLRSVLGDHAGAADAWRECVGFARAVSDLPQLAGPYKFASLARVLREHGSSLLAVEEVDAAQGAFQESRSIREAIRQPSGGDSGT